MTYNVFSGTLNPTHSLIHTLFTSLLIAPLDLLRTQHYINDFWVTVCMVKQFALCYRSVVCLSVTLVYCRQTVGWIKIKLGTEVGLGPGDTVTWGPSSP